MARRPAVRHLPPPRCSIPGCTLAVHYEIDICTLTLIAGERRITWPADPTYRLNLRLCAAHAHPLIPHAVAYAARE